MSHHSSLERQEVVGECDNCLFEQCTKFSASLASTSSDRTQSTKRDGKGKKHTPQASDEQLSFQLGSMGAAFFKCECKVPLSFAILSVDLELGLIAHQASTVRGGRTEERQEQGSAFKILEWTTKKTATWTVTVMTSLFFFTFPSGAS